VIGSHLRATDDGRWKTQGVRVLGLDHGTVRCGCAISDPTGVLVTPLEAIAPEVAIVEALVESHGVELVVVGLPRTLSGEEGEQAAIARAFSTDLERHLDIPVEVYDERLTTAMADRSGREGATSDRDSLAAAHLLEGWLASRERDGR
jgi:putative Holliday junction resolvase